MENTEEEQEDTSTPAANKRVRMPEAVYQEAKELYELGKLRLADLPAKYGFTKQAFWERFNREGVKHGSRSHEIKDSAAEAAKEAAAQDGRYASRRAAWIEETRVTGFNALKQSRMIAQKLVLDAVKDKRAPATYDDDMKALLRYQKLLTDNLGMSLNILDAKDFIDSADITRLHIEDLTDDDILEHLKETGAVAEDMTIEEMLREREEMENE